MDQPTTAAGSAALSDQAGFAQDWAFSVQLRARSGEPLLAEEPVRDADLMEARGETWFNGFLRKGFHDVPLDAVDMRHAPITTSGRCVGFSILAECAGTGTRAVQAFGPVSMTHVAQRAADRLVADGVLREGDTYRWALEAAPAEAPPPDLADDGLRITTSVQPLSYASVPLAALLSRARHMGEPADGCFPVVFTEPAHDKAWHYARKGAACTPAVETGALLRGRLCACPDTGEMFVTVDDAIEVSDATQSEFALIYTTGTWSQVESLRQRFDVADGVRLVGQSHGHNFGLEGEPCALCATARECSRTTVFVSAADRAFMRAVFAGQPFALCWIAGTNARREEVAKLFTLRAGALQPRGYHVIDDVQDS